VGLGRPGRVVNVVHARLEAAIADVVADGAVEEERVL